jgi:hypothetical protein
MKLKSKSNIEPAVAKAAGTPRREQTKNRRAAQGSMKNKNTLHIKPTVAHAAGKPKRKQTTPVNENKKYIHIKPAVANCIRNTRGQNAKMNKPNLKLAPVPTHFPFLINLSQVILIIPRTDVKKRPDGRRRHPSEPHVFSRSLTRRIVPATLACIILAACGNGNDPAQTSSAPPPDAPPAAQQDTSDIQNWAAAQTQSQAQAPSQPTTAAQQTPPPAPASDALLPPVIHTVD